MVKEKYSVAECERRFLLDGVPSGVTNPRRIVDHYIDNTRLRIRLVESTVGEPEGDDAPDIDRKLGHKRRVVADDPTTIMCTSLYLDQAEFEVVSTLPGRRLVKTRWTVDAGAGVTGAVDVFDESLTGLVVLEVDLGDESALAAFAAPPWCGPEITHVEAFTGGELAGRSFDDLAEHLAAARMTS